MTSLYGTFEYFDDAWIDNELRKLYFQKDENQSIPTKKEKEKEEKMLTWQPRPSVLPPPTTPEWVMFLKTHHPIFYQTLHRANLYYMLLTDPTPCTLLLFPEWFYEQQWSKGDLSVWACRQLCEHYWIPDDLAVCFFLSQSPAFEVYNKHYEIISCQQNSEGKMIIDQKYTLDLSNRYEDPQKLRFFFEIYP